MKLEPLLDLHFYLHIPFIIFLEQHHFSGECSGKFQVRPPLLFVGLQGQQK